MKLKKQSWSGGPIGVASVEVNPPIVNDDGTAYIPLVYQFPIGKGYHIQSESSLVRPFRKLLDSGNPIGKINFIFYSENDQHYIVGSIVNTKKRLIFFPGVKTLKITESPQDEEKLENHTLFVDHLSLEKNWKKYHISLKDKEQNPQLQVKKTKELSDDVVLWFLMAIKSLDKLEEMPKSQEFHLYGKNSQDLTRRLGEFMDARAGSVFQVLDVKGKAESNWYLNLEFFLSKKTSGDYKKESPKTKTVYYTSLVEEPVDTKIENFPTKFHWIRLKEFSGRLWVRVSRMPGILKQDSYFIPGKSF